MKTRIKVGDKVKVINDKLLTGFENGPKIKLNEEYVVKKIFLDSKDNEHFDIGLKSKLNYIRSFETKEDLPDGDKIHWCHPSRFKLI